VWSNGPHSASNLITNNTIIVLPRRAVESYGGGPRGNGRRNNVDQYRSISINADRADVCLAQAQKVGHISFCIGT
jgi:hypothetical protein